MCNRQPVRTRPVDHDRRVGPPSNAGEVRTRRIHGVRRSAACEAFGDEGPTPHGPTALPLPQTTKKAPDESGAFFVLCARGDLNPHALAGTGT